jgi:hypothetical protein
VCGTTRCTRRPRPLHYAVSSAISEEAEESLRAHLYSAAAHHWSGHCRSDRLTQRFGFDQERKSHSLMQSSANSGMAGQWETGILTGYFRLAKNNRSKSVWTLFQRKRLNNQTVWPVIFGLTGPICARALKSLHPHELRPRGHHDWPVKPTIGKRWATSRG